ncbi:MAG: bifunctional precorrin-2 dehydrogenase/sirohydrochlorin ferrochelatase [Treponema sp.]|nr:bifunctional precorrin-2 dehydrogenase/sirohydrochlorin ferrochelatase [Treponema sp.]
MAFFPLFIDLKNKPVLVIGGAEALAYQIETLISFDAKITVVSQNVSDALKKIADEKGNITFRDEPVSEQNVGALGTDWVLVITASPSQELNAAVYEFFHELHIPVEDMSDVHRCDFIFPAVIKNGDVVCGISSSGKSAHVAHFVKELVSSSVPENIGAINDRMEEIREIIKLSLPDANKRNEALKIIFDRIISDDNQISDSDIDDIMAQFGM